MPYAQHRAQTLLKSLIILHEHFQYGAHRTRTNEIIEIENRISEGRRVIDMLNSVLWSKTILHKTKKLMYQASVQSILLYGAETWSLNTQQANKLLATEMDFWRSATKSRKEKVRNVTIREVMEVGKNILEVIEEKRLRWFGHVKRMPGNRLLLKVLEWE
jgi:hypothetical protein